MRWDRLTVRVGYLRVVYKVLACETGMSDSWLGLGMDGRLILKLTLTEIISFCHGMDLCELRIYIRDKIFGIL